VRHWLSDTLGLVVQLDAKSGGLGGAVPFAKLRAERLVQLGSCSGVQVVSDAMNLNGDALRGVIACEPYASVTVRPARQCYLGFVGDGRDGSGDRALLTADCLGSVAVPLAQRWLRGDSCTDSARQSRRNWLSAAAWQCGRAETFTAASSERWLVA